MSELIAIQNIPGEANHTKELLVLKTRVGKAWEKYLASTSQQYSILSVQGEDFQREDGIKNKETNSSKQDDDSLSTRAEQYRSQVPDYSLEQLILPSSVLDELKLAVKISELKDKVFGEWGLEKIQPFPYSALNFYGNPGTGKSMAAHALASFLGRNILLASYAQIESMFHGEGPKNVEALFYAAERDNAVLFIDESDSLLSKRLTNVTQGSEQAINSMRSQLLICLERFQGVVIFATNLVQNYDPAFETRVRNIHFPMPDLDCRKRLWDIHIVDSLPADKEECVATLSTIDNVCGRDIRNAVVDTALRTAMKGENVIDSDEFRKSLKKIKNRRVNSSIDYEEITPLEGAEKDIVKELVAAQQA